MMRFGSLLAAQSALKPSTLEKLLPELIPLAILLGVVVLVVLMLPRIDVGHSKGFLRRRVINWLPLGLTYSFLYMGRYNLEKAKEIFKGRMDFDIVFGIGALVYGVSFVLNGPITDRFGGRRTIMIAALGAAVANVGMGLVAINMAAPLEVTVPFALLYAVNMYFQSFGAVAIVKVNAPWFHVRERGVFGAIFGILISLGVYFAYDWGKVIVENLPLEWVFFTPAIILIVMMVIDYFLVRDTPLQAGLAELDPGDAHLTEPGNTLTVLQIFGRVLKSKIILTIALIEFCSGFLRQAVMQYYPQYVKFTGQTSDFVYQHWGIFLCCAGILGGMVAGIISDRLFHSRRGPVALLLYAVLLVGGGAAIFGYESLVIMGPLAVLMSLAVIGVHGMLSGTASMDFGGHRNAGIAVGIIDGFVYLGTATMGLTYSVILPSAPENAVPSNWWMWPVSIVPVAVIGLLLARTLWHAKPTRGGGAH